MSEQQPLPGDAGNNQNGEAAEAELIKKVMRTQERHREGGVDPELAEGTGSNAGDAAHGNGASGGNGQGEHDGE